MDYHLTLQMMIDTRLRRNDNPLVNDVIPAQAGIQNICSKFIIWQGLIHNCHI